MMYHMNLNPVPFEQIRRGNKTIELRLYDSKRQKVKPNDIIEFINLQNGDTVCVRVVAIHTFESFEKLYSALPLLKCGYTPQNIKKASPRDMDQYYSKKEQEQWGVVGIEIELIMDK